MKRFLALMLTVLAGLSIAVAPASTAATSSTYGDYSMMFAPVYGLYGPNGTAALEWAQAPQSATTSYVYWGKPWTGPPPEYHEQFTHSGDWVVLDGWFDHGTFYRVTTTQEWQAGPDCRTGRTFLPTGGSQHYVRWAVPSAAYCLYAEGTITEESSGKSFPFMHQELWSTSASCPRPAGIKADYVCQWESYGDANGTAMTTKVERTQWIVRGAGPAQRIEQTLPSPWLATANSTGRWGS